MIVNSEFIYSDLFTLTPQTSKVSKADFSTKGKTPAYSSETTNNGRLGFVNKEPIFKITDINNVYLVFGDHTRSFNIVHEDFCVMDNVKVLVPNFRMSDEVLLFIITVWKKAIPNLGYARHWSVAKKSKILLPVRASSIPNYNYTVNDIDWQYMEERITELEQECITELDAYLKVTGLNDYELTEDDKETLSLSAKFTSNKTDGLGIDSKNGKVIFKEFRVIDVFDVRNTKNFMQSQIKLGSGHVPYLTASETNNSVASYISCDKAWLERGNCIFIGGKTLTITYQEQDFVSNDSHNLALYLKNHSVKTRFIHEYLIASLKKSLSPKYCWGDSISFKKIQSDTMKLPVDRFGEINFDYMERYIKAIEKLTIAEVVKYKDKVISATKQLVLNN